MTSRDTLKEKLSGYIEAQFLLDPLLGCILTSYPDYDNFLIYCIENFKEFNSLNISHLYNYISTKNQNWEDFLRDNFQTICNSLGFLIDPEIIMKVKEYKNLEAFYEYLIELRDSNFFITEKTVKLFNQKANFKKKTDVTLVEHKSKVNSIKQKEKDDLERSDDKITSTTTYLSKLRDKSIKLDQRIIWNNPITQFDKVENQSNPFFNLYKDRFSQLDEILQSRRKTEVDTPKNPQFLDDININERIFITGLVEDIQGVGSQLHHAKVRLLNFKLNCIIDALISLSQIPGGNLPKGVVIGVSGQVTSINQKTIAVTSEDWIRPSFTPITKKTTLENINESWIAIVGGINLQNIRKNPKWDNFLKWLKEDHPEFRLRYVVFLGGLVTNQPHPNRESIDHIQNRFTNTESIFSSYNEFYHELASLPRSIQFLIVPSPSDMTRNYLPQPSLHTQYQSELSNIHFISNPASLQIEEKNLLLYNPYLYYSRNSEYFTKPGRFLFELLEFRHLAPYWKNTSRVVAPTTFDNLVINQIPDFFFCTHPQATRIMKYKQIQIITVAPFNVSQLSTRQEQQKKNKIILINIHSKEAREIEFSS
ncbi:MAG: hypothetical protein ACXAC7_07690 [Candidatus Hodarchaeales archaeon]